MPADRSSGTMRPLNFETPATPEELPRIRQRVVAVAQECGAAPEVVERLDLVLEEALMNVALHGYGGTGGIITVSLDSVADGCLTLVLEDQGIAFDPTTKPAPDLSTPVEERPIGGLGIHLIKSMSDKVGYCRDGGRNILTLLFCPRTTADPQ